MCFLLFLLFLPCMCPPPPLACLSVCLSRSDRRPLVSMSQDCADMTDECVFGLQECVGELRAGPEHASVGSGTMNALLRSSLVFHAGTRNHSGLAVWTRTTLTVSLAWTAAPPEGLHGLVVVSVTTLPITSTSQQNPHQACGMFSSSLPSRTSFLH